MIKLLQFEWRKLWRQKSMYIIFSIGLLMCILFMLLGKILADVLHTSFGNATESMLVVLPNSGFVSLLGVYLAIFACADHSQQTIKNLYARGYSRSAVYFSKYLISLGLTMLVSIIYMVFSFFYSIILGASVSGMAAHMWGSLVLQFWVVWGLHGTFFGIGMLIGKTGGSVALNLIGMAFVFSILDLIIRIAKIDFQITVYDLENLMMTLEGAKLSVVELVRVLLVPVVYTVVFVGAGWLVNQRREV